MKFDIIANIITALFKIKTENIDLSRIGEGVLVMYELRMEYQNWGKSQEIISLPLKIVSQFQKINNEIDSLNENLVRLNPDFKNIKVNKIRFSKKIITKEVKNIFNKIKISKGLSNKIIPHVRNSLKIFLISKTYSLSVDIERVIENISPKRSPIIKNLNIPVNYREQVEEVIDLYVLGYKSTALLVLGRIFEELITKWLLKLNRDGLLEKSKDIYTMKFDNKLGLLYSRNFLPHKDWLILSKLVWDRNIGGHFFSRTRKIESEKEAEATIKLSMPLINKYKNKL